MDLFALSCIKYDFVLFCYIYIYLFCCPSFVFRNPFLFDFSLRSEALPQELSDAVRMRKMEVIATATKSACDAGVHEPLIGIKWGP